MLGYLTNKHLKDSLGYQNEGEQLFIQKIKELLNNNSGVSYSYKIHNAYSILLELKSVINDLDFGRTNGYILEEVRKEAFEILKNDIVLPKYKKALYETITDELKKGFNIDRNNQSISDMTRVHAIYAAIHNIENGYGIMDYLNDTLDFLKAAIAENKGNEILQLTECIVSSVIITKRSISSSYLAFGRYFEKSHKSFNDCWSQWAASLLKTNAEYTCYFKADEIYADKIECTVSGLDLKKTEGINDVPNEIKDSDIFYKVDIKVPSNDYFSIVEESFSSYEKEMGIVEFATAKVDSLEDKVLVYDKHFHSFMYLERQKYLTGVDYKPYNQYHKNIDRVVREFVSSMGNELDRNKLTNAIINNCNFEREGKTFVFLLLWSSLESMFRSNQYPTAISAIKDIVPNILTHRYIYYRLFDFLKDCRNTGLTYTYQGKELIADSPNDEQIKLLYELLRDDAEKLIFLQNCKDIYELLYYRGKELEGILRNAQSIKKKIERHHQVISYQLQRMYRIRNKFVHHSMIDENIDVLCKHIRVYMWEAIREMSYVGTKRNITTLEELYSYFRMNHIMMQKVLINNNSPVDINYILNGYL